MTPSLCDSNFTHNAHIQSFDPANREKCCIIPTEECVRNCSRYVAEQKFLPRGTSLLLLSGIDEVLSYSRKRGEMLVGRGGGRGGGGKGNLLRPDTNNVTASFPGMGFSIKKKRINSTESLLYGHKGYLQDVLCLVWRNSHLQFFPLFFFIPWGYSKGEEEKEEERTVRNSEEGGKGRRKSPFSPLVGIFLPTRPLPYSQKKKFPPVRLPRFSEK